MARFFSFKFHFRLLIFILLSLLAAWTFAWFLIAQPSFRRSARSSSTVSPSALEGHVRVLSEQLIPRSGGHLGNMKRTADYIRDQFAVASAGTGRVSEQWIEFNEVRRYRNISLLWGDPEKPRAVIGAHYDAYGPHPGADDNASGVAGLIELARLLAAAPARNPVELVAYPLEEPPYYATDEMGSWRHAAELKSRGIACRFMVSLEMIGYFSDQPGSQLYPIPLLRAFYPGRGNFIAVAGNLDHRGLIREFKVGMKGRTALPVYSISAPSQLPGIDFSDHRNYWRAGFPAIMITDTAFYRNTAYHTAQDTAGRLDYHRMAMVVTAVHEAILHMDGKF